MDLLITMSCYSNHDLHVWLYSPLTHLLMLLTTIHIYGIQSYACVFWFDQPICQHHQLTCTAKIGVGQARGCIRNVSDLSLRYVAYYSEFRHFCLLGETHSLSHSCTHTRPVSVTFSVCRHLLFSLASPIFTLSNPPRILDQSFDIFHPSDRIIRSLAFLQFYLLLTSQPASGSFLLSLLVT